MANIDDKKIPVGGKETPIPNRLHDVSEDHVVTGANEVFDDAFGERQSQINDKLRHYTKMAHIRIDAEEITREHNDNLLNEQINAKQLEIGAVETDIEPILDSPNMLPSGAVAFNLGWYKGNDNPEWVYCITDGAKRILAGIKRDGSVEWMVGVPTPVKNYIDAHIQELIERLEELEEHILEELEKKVDKKEGKSLIDAEYAESVSYIENPEFLEVKTDQNQRLLEGTRVDGTKVFTGDVDIEKNLRLQGKVADTLHVDKISQDGFVTEVINNPEWKRLLLTEDGRIIFGIRKDCSIEWSVGVPVPIQKAIEKIYEDGILDSFKYVSNPEYLFAVTDKEDHFLFGVTVEGVFRTAKLELLESEIETWLNEVYSIIEDPEDRLEITLDKDERMLGYREKDGTRYEEKFKTNHLSLTPTGMTEFQQALKDSGFNPGGTGDWSDAKSLEIPMPRCAMVNITAPNGDAVWPQSKGVDLQYYMEFWDMDGNYFKKEIIFNAQGNSSMAFEKKNGAVDICNNNGWDDDDTFSLKIGDWVAQDSFHFKSYHTDFIRGSSVISYQLCDEILKTRGVYADRVWKKALIDFSELGSDYFDVHTGKELTDLNVQMDTGARGFPDGFPAIFYLNGEFYGIFAWQLKKHRDNYHMKKSTAEHIHLDGDLTVGNLWGGTINWEGFEIRNPKNLICMDGSKYDGDNPKEIIDETSSAYDSTNKKHKTTAKVKKYIQRLAQRVNEIKAANETSAADGKALFDTYFDADNLIDYEIANMAVWDTDAFGKNWQWTTYDGVKWWANFYDKDMSFGNHFVGGRPNAVPAGGWIGNNPDTPIGLLITYYTPELVARWKELRELGLLTHEHIFGLIQKWIDRVGYDNFKKEYERWAEAPCNRDSHIDAEYWKLLPPVYTTTSRNDWNSSRTYAYHTMCTRRGHLYYSQQENTGVDPATDDGTNWIDLTWSADKNYNVGDYTWYGYQDFYQFRAITASTASDSKPPITQFYNKFPYELGYHDSIWRYSKYINKLMQNINNFIDSL